MNEAAIYRACLQTDASWWKAHVALPSLLTGVLGRVGRGVEVGVGFGSMSVWLLRHCPELRLTLVDPFVGYDPADGTSEWMALCGDYIAAFVRDRVASEFGDRAEVVRAASLDAAKAVADESLDFVFIDADHRYEAVAADIQAWQPKVRKGGVIAGHDYGPQWPGVAKAVKRYVDAVPVAVDTDSTIWYAVR